MFFAEPLDLPAAWAYARQPNFPENARWTNGGVQFATLHMVSTNNGRVEILKDDTAAALALVEARDEANRVWLQGAFKTAKSARATVIITQADVTNPDGGGACTVYNRQHCDAFAAFRGQLVALASGFRDWSKPGGPRKPVLLLHGDTNPYCLDKGFGGSRAPNLWRLNAWGDFRQPADATVVVVQPDDPAAPYSAHSLLGGEVPEPSCGS